VIPFAASEAERRKGQRRCCPVWFVALASFLTAGLLYPLLWLGKTWAEMQREIGDSTMRPGWHALTQLVPVYGFFRFHAHYRTIDELLSRQGVGVSATPGWAVVGWMVAQSFGRASDRVERLFGAGPEVTLILFVLSAALSAAVISYGQARLNAYWRAVEGPSVPNRIQWWEWLTLVVGVLFSLLVVSDPLVE
jgi:hypothetical protein